MLNLAITIGLVAVVFAITVFAGSLSLSPKKSKRAGIESQSLIDEMMERHKKDLCLTCMLTSGVRRGPGSAELHSRLPGDPVHVILALKNSEPRYDVFSGGYKIGSIEGKAAEELLSVIGPNRVTGAYVCEQNCYDDYRRTDIRILLFYAGAAEGFSPVLSPEWVRLESREGLRRIILCQN